MSAFLTNARQRLTRGVNSLLFGLCVTLVTSLLIEASMTEPGDSTVIVATTGVGVLITETLSEQNSRHRRTAGPLPRPSPVTRSVISQAHDRRNHSAAISLFACPRRRVDLDRHRSNGSDS